MLASRESATIPPQASKSGGKDESPQADCHHSVLLLQSKTSSLSRSTSNSGAEQGLRSIVGPPLMDSTRGHELAHDECISERALLLRVAPHALDLFSVSPQLVGDTNPSSGSRRRVRPALRCWKLVLKSPHLAVAHQKSTKMAPWYMETKTNTCGLPHSPSSLILSHSHFIFSLKSMKSRYSATFMRQSISGDPQR